MAEFTPICISLLQPILTTVPAFANLVLQSIPAFRPLNVCKKSGLLNSAFGAFYKLPPSYIFGLPSPTSSLPPTIKPSSSATSSQALASPAALTQAGSWHSHHLGWHFLCSATTGLSLLYSVSSLRAGAMSRSSPCPWLPRRGPGSERTLKRCLANELTFPSTVLTALTQLLVTTQMCIFDERMRSLSSWPATHPSVYSQHLARSVQEVWGQKVRAYTFLLLQWMISTFSELQFWDKKNLGVLVKPLPYFTAMEMEAWEVPNALCQSGQGGPNVEWASTRCHLQAQLGRPECVASFICSYQHMFSHCNPENQLVPLLGLDPFLNSFKLLLKLWEEKST